MWFRNRHIIRLAFYCLGWKWNLQFVGMSNSSPFKLSFKSLVAHFDQLKIPFSLRKYDCDNRLTKTMGIQTPLTAFFQNSFLDPNYSERQA